MLLIALLLLPSSDAVRRCLPLIVTFPTTMRGCYDCCVTIVLVRFLFIRRDRVMRYEPWVVFPGPDKLSVAR